MVIESDEWFSPFSLSEPLVERRAFERRAKREMQKMNAWASAIQGKKLSGERIANLEKMSECPALIPTISFQNGQVFARSVIRVVINSPYQQ